jgi:hypothetical protein
MCFRAARRLTPFDSRKRLTVMVRPRGRSSGPGRVKNFLFSKSSGLALGSTQPPTQWVPEALSSRVKRLGPEADHSLSASAEVKENVDLYIHSPIRLHGVVLNSFSTRTTLPILHPMI